MSEISMDWAKMFTVKKPVKKTQRSINFNEDTLKALSIITEYINSSSISETIDIILEAYIEFGEIKDLTGNILKIKDIVNKGNI